jgi:hypothetical protein
MGKKVLLCIAVVFACLTGASAWAQRPPKLPPVIYWAAGDVGAYMYAAPAMIAEKIAPVLGSKIRLIPGNDVERVNMMRTEGPSRRVVGRRLLGVDGAGPLQYLCPAPASPARLVGMANYGARRGSPRSPRHQDAVRLEGKARRHRRGGGMVQRRRQGTLAFGNLTLRDVTVVEVSTTGRRQG